MRPLAATSSHVVYSSDKGVTLLPAMPPKLQTVSVSFIRDQVQIRPQDLFPREAAPNIVAVSPDGRTFATPHAFETRIARFKDSEELLLSAISNVDNVAAASSSSFSNTSMDSLIRRSNKVGHSNKVCSVAFSNDGSLIASGSMDHYILVWRVEDGSTVSFFKEHSASVQALSFNSKDTAICSAAADGVLLVWNISSQIVLHYFRVNPCRIVLAQFSPLSDSVVVVAGLSRPLELWILDQANDLQNSGSNYNDVDKTNDPSDVSTIPHTIDERTAPHANSGSFEAAVANSDLNNDPDGTSPRQERLQELSLPRSPSRVPRSVSSSSVTQLSFPLQQHYPSYCKKTKILSNVIVNSQTECARRPPVCFYATETLAANVAKVVSLRENNSCFNNYTSTTTCVLVGCSDGKVRRYDVSEDLLTISYERAFEMAQTSKRQWQAALNGKIVSYIPPSESRANILGCHNIGFLPGATKDTSIVAARIESTLFFFRFSDAIPLGQCVLDPESCFEFLQLSNTTANNNDTNNTIKDNDQKSSTRRNLFFPVIDGRNGDNEIIILNKHPVLQLARSCNVIATLGFGCVRTGAGFLKIFAVRHASPLASCECVVPTASTSSQSLAIPASFPWSSVVFENSPSQPPSVTNQQEKVVGMNSRWLVVASGTDVSLFSTNISHLTGRTCAVLKLGPQFVSSSSTALNSNNINPEVASDAQIKCIEFLEYFSTESCSMFVVVMVNQRRIGLFLCAALQVPDFCELRCLTRMLLDRGDALNPFHASSISIKTDSDTGFTLRYTMEVLRSKIETVEHEFFVSIPREPINVAAATEKQQQRLLQNWLRPRNDTRNSILQSLRHLITTARHRKMFFAPFLHFANPAVSSVATRLLACLASNTFNLSVTPKTLNELIRNVQTAMQLQMEFSSAAPIELLEALPGPDVAAVDAAWTRPWTAETITTTTTKSSTFGAVGDYLLPHATRSESPSGSTVSIQLPPRVPTPIPTNSDSMTIGIPPTATNANLLKQQTFLEAAKQLSLCMSRIDQELFGAVSNQGSTKQQQQQDESGFAVLANNVRNWATTTLENSGSNNNNNNFPSPFDSENQHVELSLAFVLQLLDCSWNVARHARSIHNALSQAREYNERYAPVIATSNAVRRETMECEAARKVFDETHRMLLEMSSSTENHDLLSEFEYTTCKRVTASRFGVEKSCDLQRRFLSSNVRPFFHEIILPGLVQKTINVAVPELPPEVREVVLIEDGESAGTNLKQKNELPRSCFGVWKRCEIVSSSSTFGRTSTEKGLCHCFDFSSPTERAAYVHELRLRTALRNVPGVEPILFSAILRSPTDTTEKNRNAQDSGIVSSFIVAIVVAAPLGSPTPLTSENLNRVAEQIINRERSQQAVSSTVLLERESLIAAAQSELKSTIREILQTTLTLLQRFEAPANVIFATKNYWNVFNAGLLSHSFLTPESFCVSDAGGGKLRISVIEIASVALSPPNLWGFVDSLFPSSLNVNSFASSTSAPSSVTSLFAIRCNDQNTNNSPQRTPPRDSQRTDTGEISVDSVVASSATSSSNDSKNVAVHDDDTAFERELLNSGLAATIGSMSGHTAVITPAGTTELIVAATATPDTWRSAEQLETELKQLYEQTRKQGFSQALNAARDFVNEYIVALGRNLE